MQELAGLGRLARAAAADLGYFRCGRGPWRGRARAVSLASASVSQSRQMHSARSYEDAVAALNSLQSNFAFLQETKKEKPSLKDQAEKLRITKQCLELVGKGPKELSKLSVIHVAGTKGKGSTSAYCESILRHNGYHTGFFSSPHLVSVTERIRVDGQPLSAHDFSAYFWQVYDALVEKKDPTTAMPHYFSFLTVMALCVFLEEKVDVAIMEVGIGGEFDSTNILEDVAVVGITSLGIDHTSILGNSLSSIAWQKAGILKPSAIGFTVQGHTSEVLKVLYDRSMERECPLEIAPPLEHYSWPDSKSKQAALSLFHTQQINASLALQLTEAWMKRKGKCSVGSDRITSGSRLKDATPFCVSHKSTSGILSCRWPGRNQVFHSESGKITYFLDGAHTNESMEACVEWYNTNCPKRTGLQHALILNMTGDRSHMEVIRPLLSCQFQKVIFSPNIAHLQQSQGDSVNLRVSQSTLMTQTQTLHDLWVSMSLQQGRVNGAINGLNTESEVLLKECVNEALSEVESDGGEWTVLVTGSLHLVGAVLSLLDPKLDKTV